MGLGVGSAVMLGGITLQLFGAFAVMLGHCSYVGYLGHCSYVGL